MIFNSRSCLLGVLNSVKCYVVFLAIQFTLKSLSLLAMCVVDLRSFPSIALCFPTAQNFGGDEKMVAFSLWLNLVTVVTHHFLANDYGDLSFLLLF